MNFLRKHWYDLGGFFSLVVFVYVLISHKHLTGYQTLMWLSLATLFLHQLEEYRFPGTFPGMLNTAMFHSEKPDRYPLNTNTAFYVNVVFGWISYLLAAVFAEKAIWLGIATILVSASNTLAHTIVFNIKGKTIYNAGMITSIFLFVPCTYFFFFLMFTRHPGTAADFIGGILLGILFVAVGIFKLIAWMADKNSEYIFDDRNLLPKDRKKSDRYSTA